MEENQEASTAEQNTSAASSPKGGVNPLLIVGILVLLLVVGYFAFRNRQSMTAQKPSIQGNEEMMEGNSEMSETVNGPVKEFTIDGSNFIFNPNSITVNKGDTVKITFKDDDGTHNLTVDGFNISTKILGSGTSDTIQFIADKSGNFEYYCSVDGHREKGMTGTLIVR